MTLKTRGVGDREGMNDAKRRGDLDGVDVRQWRIR